MSRKLEACGLCKSYRGRQVVCGVDLTIRSGEVVGLLGPNGAGKTTSFYMVVGLVRPDQGKVLLDARDLTGMPMYLRARAGISYLPQEASVFRKLSVEENLLAILENVASATGRQRARAHDLIEEFRLQHVARSPGYALSGGERRRLEIARALAIDPGFILLDEPFAGIDPLAVHDIQNIVRRLRDKGIGILVSDHNVRETLGVCDKAYILSDGRILACGNPEQIASCPEVRAAYLGENFRL
ncbi:LPS export ABC transporter ATP-binding protein [Syntrophotalea acetylenica]|uniref:LPS export ABC transporter ATP-binding protein n=1 Tax=Syntrophotalea acetylenica TaxID=29542 RepID=UPI002A36C849|nr:LPS export ABC transporter ATP-binding protein [Syntrophotalea acetylenica]MDY0261196.1 LPS export ABC transporter ATP-binding protein [Syntrophotalea acetylenica]